MVSLVFVHASDGNNALLAKEVETRAVEMGHEVEHVSLNAFDFPVYTVAREQSTPVLEGLDELKTILDKGDAWFVFAPEYNGSYPPVLNNAIAWLSRDGDDFRRLFRDRTVALGTHSGGGGQHVIMAMRMQFSFLGCVVIGRSLVTNRKKPANPESIDAILNAMTKR
ncbi:MAG: NADPH-dependent oxidoreductase [Candidatus Poseidoniales archaeon]|nr:MAG: NADPH-dependent oxidoreductase [Candidatus Poseidoniales archaeon]